MTTLTQEHELLGIPRSVLRHRPIQPEVQEWVRLGTPRTHRSSTRQNPQASGTLPSLTQTKATVQPTQAWRLMGLSMLATLLLLWLLQGLWLWASMQLDTLHYGYPRTTQITRDVGHGGLSRFLATNEGGQIYVVEIPAAHPAAAQLLVGPHLFGTGADLAPIHLVFVGNGPHPDLLLQVGAMLMRFHNTGNTYTPTTTPSPG